MKKDIIVTNNPYVYEKFKDQFEMDYSEDYTYMNVLEKVREKVHQGHKLTTHPLSGSVKPNETPYKTIMISSGKKDELDVDGVSIIEESILTVKKFYNNKMTPLWTERVLDDFRVIDLSLIEHVIKKTEYYSY